MSSIICAFDLARHVPGMLATCSVDKTVTIWDAYNDSDKPSSVPPKPCGNKDMQVGKLYSVNFYPSSRWLMGCAGSGKELALWDMSRETTIQKRFATRIGSNPVVEEETEEGDAGKQEAFDAMMSSNPTSKNADEATSIEKNKKKKHDNKSSKKKAHKVRR